MKALLAMGMAIGLISAALALGTPANATQSVPSLPSGDSLFAINCQASGNPSVWNVRETGAATPVGSDTSVTCSAGGSYDPVSKSFYFLESHSGYYLDKFNPATGVVTRGPLTGGEMYDPHQLVITNSGQAYVVGVGNGAFFDRLDLITGFLTRIGRTNTNLYTIAYNPKNDTIYGFNGSGLSGVVYTVDPGTGSATIVQSGVHYATAFLPAPDNATPSGGSVDGATFDSHGIAWLRMDGSNSAAASIEAYNPLTNESWAMGTLVDATGRISTTPPHYWQTTTLIAGKFTKPAPVGERGASLAATGANDSGLIAGAAAFLAAGTALLIRARRKQPSQS